ncbi:MAG TPA: polymer-forming cytoskeletal protein [Usitatibacter sp.]|nr:polymer-forming cytoskeletal protein [Usitatibacter sp.]
MKYGENLFNRTRDSRVLPPGPSAPGAVQQAAAARAPAPSPAPPPAASATHLAAVPPADPAASRLIVGPNIKLRGVEIDDCDTLVVEGRVEATMVSREIQIAETGAFSGKVDVDVAEIRGAFQGEMTARRKLVIHASGRVNGKIRYGKVTVQEGGEMSGDIGAITGDAAAVKAA